MSERWRDLVLWIGAILGSLCLLWAVVGAALGLTPLVFTSGSMSPAIDAGDLSFARTVTADRVGPGDVVSVLNSDGVRITHRVVGVDPTDDGAVLTLKGDANAAPDAEAYTVSSVERVEVTVPWLGRVVDAASSPLGMFLGGLLVGGALFAGFGRRPGDGAPPRGGHRRRARTARRGTAVVALVVVGLAVASAGHGVQPTRAAFTDVGTVGSGSLASATVPAPSNFRCSGLGVLSVTFAWDAAPGATNYTLHYGSGGNTTLLVAGTSATITTVISGGTAWVVANRNFGSTVWSSGASNTRTYTVAVASLCS